MDYKWIMSGLSVDYQWIISVDSQWIMRGLSVDYEWIFIMFPILAILGFPLLENAGHFPPPNHLTSRQTQMGVSNHWGIPNSWLVYKGKSHLEMDDDWGYPYFRTPPSVKRVNPMDYNPHYNPLLCHYIIVNP